MPRGVHLILFCIGSHFLATLPGKGQSITVQHVPIKQVFNWLGGLAIGEYWIYKDDQIICPFLEVGASSATPSCMCLHLVKQLMPYLGSNQ